MVAIASILVGFVKGIELVLLICEYVTARWWALQLGYHSFTAIVSYGIVDCNRMAANRSKHLFYFRNPCERTAILNYPGYDFLRYQGTLLPQILFRLPPPI